MGDLQPSFDSNLLEEQVSALRPSPSMMKSWRKKEQLLSAQEVGRLCRSSPLNCDQRRQSTFDFESAVNGCSRQDVARCFFDLLVRHLKISLPFNRMAPMIRSLSAKVKTFEFARICN